MSFAALLLLNVTIYMSMYKLSHITVVVLSNIYIIAT